MSVLTPINGVGSMGLALTYKHFVPPGLFPTNNLLLSLGGNPYVLHISRLNNGIRSLPLAVL